jgi:2,3-bisphosphoglycerate-independent phosphoglycerate mutase
MGYAVILPDGAADEPVPELDGRTPLESAKKPHMDWVAANGRLGTVVTAPPGFAPGSDVCTLSLLGYDPRVDYDGRAPLEAAAQGISAEPGELIFRCNFVTISDGRMLDFTAGHITQPEADRLVADLNAALEDRGGRFHRGVSYRNLFLARPPAEAALNCTPPHDIPNRPVAEHLPQGAGASWAIEVMRLAHDVLAGHEVNLVRRDVGENPATDIWLWGQGRPKALEGFENRFGLCGATIAAVDLIRGIARTIGLTLIHVPGATGYIDTDYAAKGRAAVAALDHYDLVIVHVEAPDEAGHQGDAAAKVTALERIDEHIVGPVLERVRRDARWGILIAPDHPTPVARRVHSSTPPPFCLAGSAFGASTAHAFTEAAAVATGFCVNPGHELMAYFLKP